MRACTACAPVPQGEADATWVFMGWEGIEAKRKGVELNAFGLEEFGVPYGYSPLLIAHPDTIRCGPGPGGWGGGGGARRTHGLTGLDWHCAAHHHH